MDWSRTTEYKDKVIFGRMVIHANDALMQERRGFLLVAGTAAAAFALGGLPFAARAAGDAIR